MMKYLVSVLAIAAVTALGAAWWMWTRVDTLKEENAALERSLRVMQVERDLARESRDVARAEADRVRGKAEEFDRLRESLWKGTEDAPVPDWLRDYLDRLFAD